MKRFNEKLCTVPLHLVTVSFKNCEPTVIKQDYILLISKLCNRGLNSLPRLEGPQGLMILR
jgi:hypothetical protein